jgi:hypothetical protein
VHSTWRYGAVKEFGNHVAEVRVLYNSAFLHVVWDIEFFNVLIMFCTYKCVCYNAFIHPDFPKRPQAFFKLWCSLTL